MPIRDHNENETPQVVELVLARPLRSARLSAATWSAAELVLLTAGFLICRAVLCPRLGSLAINVGFITLFVLWFAWIGYISPFLIHGDTRPQRGTGGRDTLFIRTDNFRPAAWRFGAVTLLGVILIVGTTWIFRPDFAAQVRLRSFLSKQFLYLGSSWLQGTIFFGFFLLRIREIVPSRAAAALATALLFAAFHTPNWPLASLSFLAGLVWAGIYYEYPNLLALMLSHSLLGTVLHQVAHLNMRCGPNYYGTRSSVEHLFPSAAHWFFSYAR